MAKLIHNSDLASDPLFNVTFPADEDGPEATVNLFAFAARHPEEDREVVIELVDEGRVTEYRFTRMDEEGWRAVTRTQLEER